MNESVLLPYPMANLDLLRKVDARRSLDVYRAFVLSLRSTFHRRLTLPSYCLKQPSCTHRGMKMNWPKDNNSSNRIDWSATELKITFYI